MQPRSAERFAFLYEDCLLWLLFAFQNFNKTSNQTRLVFFLHKHKYRLGIKSEERPARFQSV